jgi:DNA-binding NarL/FixJ family response regulator
MRTVLRTLFKQDGSFDFCVEARGGTEAIDKARHLLRHLAILDFSLPEMNGFQLA